MEKLELPMFENTTPARSLGILTVCPEAKPVALPLAEVTVTGRAVERIADITIIQKFRNAYDEPLEAVYIFPLAGGAAVRDFELRVGTRTIRGTIEERQEARNKYQKALEEGKRTALMEQERDDVFTVHVGNLPPKEEITVRIVYSERLPFLSNGTTELRIPLVVAPRYIPGNPSNELNVGDGFEEDTDIVRDASRISPPRLAKGSPSQTRLSIDIEVLDQSIADLCCTQHAVRSNSSSGTTKVSLARQDEFMNQDFILRWSVASKSLRPSLIVCRDEQNAYGMLSIYPPKQNQRQNARDVIFVLDRSGSMEGAKMASAARACSILLSTLTPQDRFAILAFDNTAEWLHSQLTTTGPFLKADEAGIERGLRHLREITARGGTEMFVALQAAISAIGNLGADNNHVPVIVLITDGQVGDESRILESIQKNLGNTRMFTVGVDTAVNRSFLQRLAQSGKGTSIFVEPGVQLEEALRLIGREIGNPVLTDIKLANLNQNALTPFPVPDLFEGHGSTAFFRSANTSIQISGTLSDGTQYRENVTAKEVDLPAIAHLWARSRVMDLEDRYRLDPSQQESLRKEIIALALQHHLLTRFTAFVVVDEMEVVNADGKRRKVIQPVHMPAQWEMEMAPQPVKVAPMAMATMELSAAPAARRALGRPIQIFEEASEKIVDSIVPSRKRGKDFDNLLDQLRERNNWDQLRSIQLLQDAQQSMLHSRSRQLKEFAQNALAELIKKLEAKSMTFEEFALLLEECRKQFEKVKKPFWY
jgi:Ca-activated chloride channel family protein